MSSRFKPFRELLAGGKEQTLAMKMVLDQWRIGEMSSQYRQATVISLSQ